MNTRIEQLTQLGQSIWYDNIERRLLENGQLGKMVLQGDIRGLTSNPSIFHNAIANSHDYDKSITTMAWAGLSAKVIVEYLTIEDIQAAADLLRPVFDDSLGDDGYVSLEVSPDLAYESEATFLEALRLWGLVNRPNLMIKIPATRPGLVAIQRTIAAGINVNVTLIFSINRYKEVMNAYLVGLEERISAGLDVNHISSVASFFISRMDSKVDKLLDNLIATNTTGADKAAKLLGKAAIANARLAYLEFLNIFQSERFNGISKMGGRLQKPLWASTSTKNPAYPDTMYVDELIGAHTVNTVPPQTLVAFREHGRVRQSIGDDLAQAKVFFEDLQKIGISIDQVTDELEDEGVQAFAHMYQALLGTVEQRRIEALQELGPLQENIAKRISILDQNQVPERLYRYDPLLWTADAAEQAEIKIRLGWLKSPENSRPYIPEFIRIREHLISTGFTHALVLGMGGSSLAPEVFQQFMGSSDKNLQISILDSTDPEQVTTASRHSPAKRTLYIVASKSGGTAEVNAFLDYFWQRTQRIVGKKETPNHFIAITDPGTALEKLAKERKFRAVILADPTVGGRYSALTAFGLLPAALMGIDLEQLLDRASMMAKQCTPENPSSRSPGIVLGAILGEAFLMRRDKLTFIADPEIEPFASWLEQLVAESSGKHGKGIIPVAGEPPCKPEEYQTDRLFIYLKRSGQNETLVKKLLKLNHPVITVDLPDLYSLGEEFYRWEIAIAIACSIIGINAFDQPDVQDAKNRTKEKINQYLEHHYFDEGTRAYSDEYVSLFGYGLESISSLHVGLQTFLKQLKINDYIAINAYLPRDQKTIKLLQQLRIAIRSKSGLATTVGFGPRFLHSTGQLHKGGSDNGLFVIITHDPPIDINIPGEGISFGTLIRGQALGDMEALHTRNRRVLRVHLKNRASLKVVIDSL